MSKKKIGDVELDDLHYHELMDRLSVVMETLDNSIVQHPAAKIETTIKDEITTGYDHLFKAYQLVSQIRFNTKEK